MRAGNQKGRVERAIRYVRESFFAGRPFTTLAECNRQALQWRDQVAQVFAEEQPRLLPPPVHPFPTDLVMAVRSGETIYVRFDLNDYSIPPEAVGRQRAQAIEELPVLRGIVEQFDLQIVKKTGVLQARISTQRDAVLKRIEESVQRFSIH